MIRKATEDIKNYRSPKRKSGKPHIARQWSRVRRQRLDYENGTFWLGRKMRRERD